MSGSINTRNEILPLAVLMQIWSYWWIHYLYSSASEIVHIRNRMLVHYPVVIYNTNVPVSNLFIFFSCYYKILVGSWFSKSLWIPSSFQTVMVQSGYHSNINHSRAWLAHPSSLLRGYQIQENGRIYQWAQWTTSQFYKVIFPSW